MKRKSMQKGGVIGGGRSIVIRWIPAMLLAVGLARTLFGGVIGGS